MEQLNPENTGFSFSELKQTIERRFHWFVISIIVTLILLTATVASRISKPRTTTYAYHLTIFVEPISYIPSMEEVRTLGTTEKLFSFSQEYQLLTGSNGILQKIQDIDPSDLQKVAFSKDEGTHSIKISYSSPDLEHAKNVVHAIVEAFDFELQSILKTYIGESQNLISILQKHSDASSSEHADLLFLSELTTQKLSAIHPLVTVVDEGEIENRSSAIFPSKTKKTLFAILLLGFGAGIFLCLLSEELDSSVFNDQSVLRFTPTAWYVSIPYHKENNPYTANAFHYLSALLHPGTIYVFWGMNARVGTTSTLHNLAEQMERSGKKACIKSLGESSLIAPKGTTTLIDCDHTVTLPQIVEAAKDSPVKLILVGRAFISQSKDIKYRNQQADNLQIPVEGCILIGDVCFQKGHPVTSHALQMRKSYKRNLRQTTK